MEKFIPNFQTIDWGSSKKDNPGTRKGLMFMEVSLHPGTFILRFRETSKQVNQFTKNPKRIINKKKGKIIASF